jgi:hypothetical protein
MKKRFFFEKKNQKTFVGFYTGFFNVPREAKAFCRVRVPMTERSEV